MAKALGGHVSPAPVKEIGWGKVKVEGAGESAVWFERDGPEFLSFHWHGETFSIPPGATRVLSSPWCANQAFALGKHLALQCHIEMTDELVRTWCQSGAGEIARSGGPGVQSVDTILADLAPKIDALHSVADRVYARWLQGVRE
jgi:GMP synthase-like glutamine amidotransferase